MTTTTTTNRFNLDTLRAVRDAKSLESALAQVDQAALLELAQRFCRQAVANLERQKKMRELYQLQK